MFGYIPNLDDQMPWASGPQDDMGDSGIGLPILNSGVVASSQLYREDLEHPAIQSPQFGSDSVDFERWTNFIIIPVLPTPQMTEWDDYTQQLPWPEWTAKLAEYEDRTLQIFLPPQPADQTGYDASKRWDDWVASLSEYDDWPTQLVVPIFPINQEPSWDDYSQQLRWADWASPAAEYEERGLAIVLPPPGWDTDADQQIPTPLPTSNLGSEPGQDTTNFIILPPISTWATLPPDGDPPNPPIYFITGHLPEDELVGIPIPNFYQSSVSVIYSGRIYITGDLQKHEQS